MYPINVTEIIKLPKLGMTYRFVNDALKLEKDENMAILSFNAKIMTIPAQEFTSTVFVATFNVENKISAEKMLGLASNEQDLSLVAHSIRFYEVNNLFKNSLPLKNIIGTIDGKILQNSIFGGQKTSAINIPGQIAVTFGISVHGMDSACDSYSSVLNINMFTGVNVEQTPNGQYNLSINCKGLTLFRILNNENFQPEISVSKEEIESFDIFPTKCGFFINEMNRYIVPINSQIEYTSKNNIIPESKMFYGPRPTEVPLFLMCDLFLAKLKKLALDKGFTTEIGICTSENLKLSTSAFMSNLALYKPNNRFLPDGSIMFEKIEQSIYYMTNHDRVGANTYVNHFCTPFGDMVVNQCQMKQLAAPCFLGTIAMNLPKLYATLLISAPFAIQIA